MQTNCATLNTNSWRAAETFTRELKHGEEHGVLSLARLLAHARVLELAVLLVLELVVLLVLEPVVSLVLELVVVLVHALVLELGGEPGQILGQTPLGV
jgi:hypothetical protein